MTGDLPLELPSIAVLFEDTVSEETSKRLPEYLPLRIVIEPRLEHVLHVSYVSSEDLLVAEGTVERERQCRCGVDNVGDPLHAPLLVPSDRKRRADDRKRDRNLGWRRRRIPEASDEGEKERKQ